MTELKTSIRLKAPPLQVWAVLTAFSDYTRWHALLNLDGTAAVGSEIVYSLRRTAERSHYINTEVLIIECEEPKKLAWRIGLPKLIVMEESFKLEADDSGTILQHEIKPSGVLSWLAVRLAGHRLWKI
ncbi:SRPBCC family protein [Allosphingosinicella sp.]|uniref:SRPBCC family protein n=1 Tax=Allosphingosinicella sp. TaxID=2823234 RepID=UPI002FC19F35